MVFLLLFIVSIYIILLINILIENFLKYKTYLKNKDEILKIKDEWLKIKKYLSSINNFDKKLYQNFLLNNGNIIVNTKIFKRYTKYYYLNEIPYDVYLYVAVKIMKKQNSYYYENNNKISFNKENEYIKLLNLNKDFTYNDVKKSYRCLIKKYHPDKLNHLTELEKIYFENISKNINEAYSYFKKKYKKN